MAPTESLPERRRTVAVAAVVLGVSGFASEVGMLASVAAIVCGVIACRGDGVSRLLGIFAIVAGAARLLIAAIPLLAPVTFALGL